ncbi:MAG TPA: hypothetical protein VM531_11990 [Sphingomicrobium sp.]|jgi:hypothetical protein|nr:hypothetical protein [Sphingomicrobium sp.]
MKHEDTTAPGPPPKDGSVFRAIIGFLALGAGIAGFGALYFIAIPDKNENALMFALGIIFQWGSSVLASEYGATTTGRRVAESAIKKIERTDLESEKS